MPHRLNLDLDLVLLLMLWLPLLLSGLLSTRAGQHLQHSKSLLADVNDWCSAVLAVLGCGVQEGTGVTSLFGISHQSLAHIVIAVLATITLTHIIIAASATTAADLQHSHLLL